MKYTLKLNPISYKSELFRLVVFMFCLFISKINFSQMPSLGQSSTFALFSNAGNFANTGSSVVTGDIGTYVGSLTGFPPGTLNGTKHVADSISVNIALVVDSVYSFLSTLNCDTVIGTILGNNQILYPKIYSTGAASTLVGDLVLDAQGDANAVFVFQIDGAFTTETFTSITLINAASICNIFWQINGLFSLGESSVFQGTIVSNGAITLLNGSTLYGRALTKAGAISVQTSTVALTCYTNVLPIELIRFDAECYRNLTLLKWCTVSETNNDHFTLERSYDAIKWDEINSIRGAGNSYNYKNYEIVVSETMSGTTYYRIKQTDFNGEYSYSKIITYQNCKSLYQQIKFYPNPTKGLIHFELGTLFHEFQSIRVYNIFGKIVYSSNAFDSILDLSTKEEGLYFIELNLNSGTLMRRITMVR